MKRETRTIFISDDGQEFVSREACEEHERVHKLWEIFRREGVGRGGEWSEEMFMNFLVGCREEIGVLLIPELLAEK